MVEEDKCVEFLFEAKGSGKGNWEKWATGTARFIVIDEVDGNRYPDLTEIHGLTELQSGEIMVSPKYYPAMMDHSQQVDGFIIYDEHHATSRGPVVSHQFGIPSVFSCVDEISEINKGDKLKINGVTGEVYRIK